jgi:hypothetical protein
VSQNARAVLNTQLNRRDKGFGNRTVLQFVAMTEADTHDPIAAVRALADELTKTIGLASALAESGRDIDLAGLDHQIGLLCAKSLDLPPDEGRRVRPRLIALSGSVEALSRALAARAGPSG